MRKQRKKYKRPTNLFSPLRIESDRGLVKKYGLKNRTEIWRAESKVSRFRNQAKKIIVLPEKQKTFFEKLEKIGIIKKTSESTIDAVLSLKKEDLLERRLQTIVFKLRLAKTPNEARQLITHRKIKISNKIVTIPSYIVKLEEENKISLVKQEKKEKIEKVEKQEVKEEKIEETRE